jgi:hypothetical protein
MSGPLASVPESCLRGEEGGVESRRDRAEMKDDSVSAALRGLSDPGSGSVQDGLGAATAASLPNVGQGSALFSARSDWS